ncbi:Prolyl 3-hydroxylase 1 [Tetrabaena socialis]|uniref:procollagen-proline 3-dioxygenase n=1 Tax=Tetrabaena socialis TaxID=47790 RepID=A0A2J8ABN2_9CHLO|nr:Prolyl 3-hydroxylase 1 [Tetrabaena socialis]|eukprot:PNH09916.1 Prolyl 3-hydroxylase 1 [Tetrabaena socialis]
MRESPRAGPTTDSNDDDGRDSQASKRRRLGTAAEPAPETTAAVEGVAAAGICIGAPAGAQDADANGKARAGLGELEVEARAAPAEGGSELGGPGAHAASEAREDSYGAGPDAEAAEGGPGGADVEAAVGRPHPRLARLPRVRAVLDGVVPPELCAELVFALQAISTVGYRPHVRSATIHDVVATAPWLLPPLLRARAAVLAAVEVAFGLALELCVEFSGLIGWDEGASLGWHHDANREYLASRHLSAVLYLNNQGDPPGAFGGGDFRFQDGAEPLRVTPRVGRMVAYTADARNVHCVERVMRGERCTLTLWFSLDPAAAEDGKVPGGRTAAPEAGGSPGVAPDAGGSPGRSQGVRRQPRFGLGRGLPDTMYQLSPGEGGGDLRLERLRRLGLYALGWAEHCALQVELKPCRHPASTAAATAAVQEALLAAQFASYRLGVARLACIRQLEGVLGELRGLVAESMQEVRAAVPRWLALGSLLSTG